MSQGYACPVSPRNSTPGYIPYRKPCTKAWPKLFIEAMFAKAPNWGGRWGNCSKSVESINKLGKNLTLEHYITQKWTKYLNFYSSGRLMTLQFSSVAQSCPALCDPMNCSTPGLPVHHKLQFTQTHVHRVSDAIQPSHPLSSPSPPAPNPSKHQGLFQWVNSSHQVAKVLELQFQHQSFQWTHRTELLQDELVGSPCSPRDSQESSPTSQFKSINISVLSFLHSPTFTSIHDHWKNHSFD